MAMKTIICLSFIVLNNFFANMCVKKKLCLTNQKPHHSSLEFKEHIKTLENKVACAFGILTKLKYIFPKTTLLKLYFAHMHPILLYNYLGGTFPSYLQKLQILQKSTLCN